MNEAQMAALEAEIAKASSERDAAAEKFLALVAECSRLRPNVPAEKLKAAEFARVSALEARVACIEAMLKMVGEIAGDDP